MRIDHLARCTINMCAALIIFSGCGGARNATLPSAGADQANTKSRQPSRAWMDPSASSQNLLYISSNDRGNVYAYTYPQGKLVGTLTGFISPFGECTDAAGDVFIVAYSAPSMTSSTIYEYAHGGSNPIAMLSDPNVAFGCAVDQSTGNLAASGAGIAIFAHASGTPKLYHGSVPLYYCSYDQRGNLFVSGVNSQYGNQAALYRFPKGGHDLEQIRLNAKIYTPTFEGPPLQWTGKYLTVSSNPLDKPITVYRLRISGSNATVAGTTTLTPKRRIYEFGMTWVQGKSVIGFDPYKRGYDNADFWPYPKGGLPKQAIRKVGDIKQQLWGVTVSVAPSR